MRRYYDRDHLSTANRPQVFNRILLRQPHGASGRRHLYSDTMRTNGCTHPNNRSRPCILGTILSCQHKLRTHPQSDHTSGPSTSNGTSTNNHLVILSKPRKSGPPPLPNLMGELMIISSLFHWSNFTLLITGLGTLITAGYSLYLFLISQRGQAPEHIINLVPTYTREHLLICLHMLPLILLILKPELIWGAHWCKHSLKKH